MPAPLQVFKHTVTLKGLIIFYSIILFDLALVLVRTHPFTNHFFTEVFSHISNFAITSMLMATAAFIMAMQGGQFKLVIWLGLAAVVLNFVVELFATFLNTPDITDAVYGSAGVVITGMIMYVFYQTGVRKTP